MATGRSLRTTFDDAAHLYDEARPGYPEQLVEDVILLSEIPPGGSILEIGCGTGQATLPFAKRGYSMLCLELGRELARLASEHCRPYRLVEIQNVSFEEWPLCEKAFDLVMSAQAFHWISPRVRFTKAAASLRDTGAIALFWNDNRGADTPFFRAVKELYRQRTPQLVDADSATSPDALEREPRREIDASGLFGDVAVRQYRWPETYRAERYVKLLSTYSVIRSLEEETRRSLLEAIRELIERCGGVVETEYVTRLYVAKVRT